MTKTEQALDTIQKALESLPQNSLCVTLGDVGLDALSHIRARLSKPAPPAPISEEAQSLMDTTAGGRATADLVSDPPEPGEEERRAVMQLLEEGYDNDEAPSPDVLARVRALILAPPARTVSVTREWCRNLSDAILDECWNIAGGLLRTIGVEVVD